MGWIRPGAAFQRVEPCACGIDAMHSKDILWQIDSDGDNGSHGQPLPTNK